MVGALVGPASGAGREHVVSPVPVARDGPFGIAIGEPLADLHAVFLHEQGYAENASYQVPHPPKPNADFPLVEVVGFPATGVCEIAAFSNRFEADPSGEKAKAFVDRTAELLKAKYGPEDVKEDDCEDSDAECSQTWTFELLEHRATYAYIWRSLPPARYGGISRMLTTILTKSASSPVAVVLYNSNTKACNDALDAVSATGL
jgi:hypothetical protein